MSSGLSTPAVTGGACFVAIGVGNATLFLMPAFLVGPGCFVFFGACVFLARRDLLTTSVVFFFCFFIFSPFCVVVPALMLLAMTGFAFVVFGFEELVSLTGEGLFFFLAIVGLNEEVTGGVGRFVTFLEVGRIALASGSFDALFFLDGFTAFEGFFNIFLGGRFPFLDG